MAKNRKAKKAAKKFQEKHVPTTLAQTKPEKTTAMAEAMSKASKASVSVKKPETKKEKPKETKKKLIQPKTIIGFGSKGNSKTIHAIAAIDRSALCDIRIKNIDPDNSIAAKNVTCANCKKYSTFKQLLASTSSVEENEEKPIEEKPKPPVKKEQKKLTKKLDEESQDYVTIQQITSMLNTRVKNMEKRLRTHFEEMIDNIICARPDFFIVKADIDHYSIVHNNSRLIICNGLTLVQAEKLLPLYMSIEYKWDGNSKMPQEWMTSVKAVFDVLKEQKKEPKQQRKIKRRVKQEPIRKLKRRKKQDKPRRIKRRSRE